MRIAPERGRGLTDEELNAKTLDSRLKLAASKAHDEDADEKVTMMEAIRVETKKFMASSWFGRIYDRTLLYLSVLSCLEFIFQTYLHPEKHASLLVNISNSIILPVINSFDNYFSEYTQTT